MKGSTIEQQQPDPMSPQTNGSTPTTNGHHCNGVSNGIVSNQTNGSNPTQNGISTNSGRTSPRSNGGSTSPRCPLEKPFLIGVAGGTACGKASVCARIMEQLGQHKVAQKERRVVIVSMDSFYRPLTDEDQTKARKGQFNFDHPAAFDHHMMADAIRDITAGRTVKVPLYDFIHHKWKPDCYQTIYPADVVIVEGILTFYFPEVLDLFDMKLFVDTDPDTRLSRRVMRDVQEHGRDIEQILYQYTTFVKPAFEEFCLPTKKYADVIIPRGADNTVAIELIVQHIQDLLQATPLKEMVEKNGGKMSKEGVKENGGGKMAVTTKGGAAVAAKGKVMKRVPSVSDNVSRPH